MMPQAGYSSNHGDLPKQFVSSLRVLFDILDDNRSGLVNLSDIESRWKEDVDGLPKGVIQAWRNVAFPDRKLDFDRFINGIRVATSQNHNGVRNGVRRNMSHPVATEQIGGKQLQHRNAPLPHPDIIAHHSTKQNTAPLSPNRQHSRESASLVYGNRNSVADDSAFSSQPQGNRPVPTVNEHGAMSNMRTFSMPQLTNVPKHKLPQSQNRSLSPSNLGNSNSVNSKDNIVDVLKKWQHDRMGSKNPNTENWRSDDPRASVASMSALDRYVSGAVDKSYPKSDNEMAVDDTAVVTNRRRVSRRSDGRRHTVTNSVDFQMLKRMKQLEEEKDVLMQGLEMLERARQWYHTQIHQLQDRQKYLGTAQQDYSLDSHQEKIDLQSARISALNQQLLSLVDSSKKGLSLHMNLAARSTNSPQKVAPSGGDEVNKQLQEQRSLISRLKHQNQQLTSEVSQKAEHIARLEQERVQVVREMFEMRQKFQDRAKTGHSIRGYEESSYI